MAIQSHMAKAISALQKENLKAEFVEQDEFILIENLLSPEDVKAINSELPKLYKAIHRNYVPWRKKGGSISRVLIDRMTQVFAKIYYSPALLELLRYLVDSDLKDCPEDDSHAYALYCYTEPGDHVGYHYDTSFYKGQRYTGLLGLIDESSCELECILYKDNPHKESKHISVIVSPGAFVFFNGDRLYHKVTPLQKGEKRIVLTMEYLTDHRMTRFGSFISKLKDAIGYFGFYHVFIETKKNTDNKHRKEKENRYDG